MFELTFAHSRSVTARISNPSNIAHYAALPDFPFTLDDTNPTIDDLRFRTTRVPQLRGTTTVETDERGIAKFTDLSVDTGPPGQYLLEFEAEGVPAPFTASVVFTDDTGRCLYDWQLITDDGTQS